MKAKALKIEVEAIDEMALPQSTSLVGSPYATQLGLYTFSNVKVIDQWIWKHDVPKSSHIAWRCHILV